METPQWWDDLFVDADLLTAASQQVLTSLVTLPAAGFTPGWFNGPDTGSITFSTVGFNITTQFMPISLALFNTGMIAGGYGTTDGQAPTFQYSNNFNSLVPGSGSVTAYLVATPVTIQQAAVQVTGPPPFHPDYDPTFEPYEAFLTKQDSLELIATLTAPDNLTSLELCRVVLTASETTFTSLDFSHAVRAGALLSRNGEVLSADIQDSIVLPGNPSSQGDLTSGGDLISHGSIQSTGIIEAGTFLTAAEGATGTGNPAIATLLGDFGSSLAAQGYQFLPSGLLIQWGYLPTGNILTNSESEGGLTWYYGYFAADFPISFPTTCLNIHFTPEDDIGHLLFNVSVQSVSKTGFICVPHTTASDGHTISFFYIAIGY